MSYSKAKSNIKSKHDLYSDRSKWVTNGIRWLDHLEINIKSMYLLFRFHWQVVQCSSLATQSKARGGDLSHLICEKCNITKRYHIYATMTTKSINQSQISALRENDKSEFTKLSVYIFRKGRTELTNEISWLLQLCSWR